MGDLTPIAFDIETSGLGPDAIVTVVGFAHEPGVSVVLNTDGRTAETDRLTEHLIDRITTPITLEVCTDERALLARMADIADRIDSDQHYLCAYNGETWNGGFDLPFLRSRCIAHDRSWPFAGFPYVDILAVIDRFETDDRTDLDSVYEALVGAPTCDPFDASAEAVTAFEHGDWLPLLFHNIADVRRTRELSLLAEQYVPVSDFGMKNLDPPSPQG
ncbi:MAG: ribonuclease H-like domain-containing protein [Halovenus sp.]